MKTVYVVYNTGSNIGKSIEVFNDEGEAAIYASKHDLQVIEKLLI
tara:strand:- start:363 stop:497 length:135 start_codon:yes stop_codon:yes gene_type:complete